MERLGVTPEEAERRRALIRREATRITELRQLVEPTTVAPPQTTLF